MANYDDFENPAPAHAPSSLFAVKGDLDGNKARDDFQEREQFIGLKVGEEEFLMPIASVREINMLSPITFVPNAPTLVDGVINLRGNILPAVNMRKMMGVARGKPTGACRIIIVRCEDVNFGLLVDGITYVISLLPSEIEHQTLPGKGTGAEYIGSISKQGNRIRGIIDLARVVRAAAGADLNAPDDTRGGEAGEDEAA